MAVAKETRGPGLALRSWSPRLGGSGWWAAPRAGGGPLGGMDHLGGVVASGYREGAQDREEELEGGTAGTKGSKLPPICSAPEPTKRKVKKKKKKKKTEGSGKGDGKRNS